MPHEFPVRVKATKTYNCYIRDPKPVDCSMPACSFYVALEFLSLYSQNMAQHTTKYSFFFKGLKTFLNIGHHIKRGLLFKDGDLLQFVITNVK
jgi:hypothetical protein